MKSLLFTCCFFVAFAFHAQAQTAAQKVIALEKQRFTAMVSKDTAFLYKVLAEDLLYSHSTGEVDSRQSLIRSIGSGKLDYQQMELEGVESRVYKKTVILNGTMRLSVRSNDQVLNLKIKYLDVYRKIDGRWQLVAWQSAKLTP
jgi:hypothetical protein